MVFGAGIASADSGAGAGTTSSAVQTGGAPQRAERVARRAPDLNERPVRAAAARAGGARVAPVVAAFSKPAIAPAPQAAPAAATVGGGLKQRLAPSPAAAKPAASAAAAAAPVVPSSVPVDPAKFAGTYYEQGSVKQFFSIGLVNTTATYTLNPDGTIKVQNSGNYFFNRGPRSSIVGSAVVVNDTNTALNVGFFRRKPPAATPPGNYTILANAPDYSWVIVSDPSGHSGYILTRSKTISPQEYGQLVSQAQSLGVTGRITPTRQFA